MDSQLNSAQLAHFFTTSIVRLAISMSFDHMTFTTGEVFWPRVATLTTDCFLFKQLF